jgi:hypothetical protein
LRNIESRDSNSTHNTNALYTRYGPQRNFAVRSNPPAHHSGAGIVDEFIWLYLRNALDPDPHFGHPWTALCQPSQRYCIRVPIPVLNRVSSYTDNLDGHSHDLELDKYAGSDNGVGPNASYFFYFYSLHRLWNSDGDFFEQRDADFDDGSRSARLCNYMPRGH